MSIKLGSVPIALKWLDVVSERELEVETCAGGILLRTPAGSFNLESDDAAALAEMLDLAVIALDHELRAGPSQASQDEAAKYVKEEPGGGFSIDTGAMAADIPCELFRRCESRAFFLEHIAGEPIDPPTRFEPITRGGSS